ncbi:DUF488 family protein [Frankia sp. QA3]|uniref:DUF488 family protein n=1 Tax=Frankia sp. QA3 TaxID=710111 RepID=UPI0002E3B747|nr:DUF488 family protein [Frankia sp. QA3]
MGGYTRRVEPAPNLLTVGHGTLVAAVDELLAEAATIRTAVRCAETLWWRCHRRMIADFVTLARGGRVSHLHHDGRLDPHRPTAGVRRRDDGLLVYDAGSLFAG